MSNLVQFTPKGIFCPKGNFYIDPWQPVDYALITHAHADHARAGNRNYLAHAITVEVMKCRLGENRYQSVEWGDQLYINGVKVSFHPAGHIAGSSQIRLEYKGEVWVIAGDYKLENDGVSGPFQPLVCNYFITESTFGLPIYKWQKQVDIQTEIIDWISANKAKGRASVLIAYSLGKAQRLIELLRPLNQKIYAHGAVYNMQRVLIEAGLPLADVERVTNDTPKDELKNAVIIAPSGAEASTWIRRFDPFRSAICSGWMQVRGNVRRSKADRGFALSDHADWDDLLTAVKASKANKVFVTHGFQATFSRYLNETGIESEEVPTQFGHEEEEETTEKD